MPNGENFDIGEAGIEPQRSTLAAIAAGVLVVIAGFLVYNYFSNVGKDAEPEVGQEAAIFTEEDETGLNIPEPGTIEEDEGIVVVEDTEIADEETDTTDETSEDTSSDSETAAPVVAGTWTLNDHEPDSISGDSYTVKAGDTLWEIAEARYGTGFDWGKILEANKDSVGFLPNGSQALIEVGQTLILP